MHKIVISDKCACFKKSNLQTTLSFTSKDEALLKAIEINNHMNENFCNKHQFEVQEMFDNFVISFYDENKQVCCGNGCCD